VDRPTDGGRNPFVGPRSIRQGEPIYGRSSETNELCSTLVAARIVLLYAVSGAGKTSLLEAGLRPELERRDFAVLPTVRVGYDVSHLEDGTAVNRYTLSTMLSLEEGRPAAARLHPGELSGLSLDEYVGRLVHGRDDERDPCLFFDQFEELFTLDPVDDRAKRDFVEQLGVVLRDTGIWALFSMREDFIAQLAPYAALVPESWETRHRLELLGPAAARAAIQQTAAEAGRVFTDAAAEALIDDLRRVRVQRGPVSAEALGPHVEPVQLQVVCRELWDRVDPEAVSIEAGDVHTVGDVNDALARFYEHAVAVTSHRTRVPAYPIRFWFSNVLITPFGTRGMALQGLASTGGLPNDAVAALEDLHMIRAETRAGARWYELTHDRFIEPIQASNARALSRPSPPRWGLVPLIGGFAVMVIFAFTGFGRGAASTIPLFVSGCLVGLGLGELLATAFDTDERRLTPSRPRRGWRLGLGIVSLVVAAVCVLCAIAVPLTRPESSDDYVITSLDTGTDVDGYVNCHGTSLEVFTQHLEPDVTNVLAYPPSARNSRSPTPSERAALQEYARGWCRTEATTFMGVGDIFLALAVGLVTLVAVTWRRRRRRRAIALGQP
jgi:hypothetical protein